MKLGCGILDHMIVLYGLGNFNIYIYIILQGSLVYWVTNSSLSVIQVSKLYLLFKFPSKERINLLLCHPDFFLCLNTCNIFYAAIFFYVFKRWGFFLCLYTL